MSLTVNLYYTGINGNAKKFADEMESSGIANAIRAEKGNLRYDSPTQSAVNIQLF